MNPFEVERKRAELALRKNYNELKKLYSLSLPEIPNTNTPLFWDKRNKERSNLRKTNPMSFHKYKIVSNMLPRKGAILNIGAGSGELERNYFSKNKNELWVGTDIAPHSVAYLKKHYSFADFRKADVLKLPFKPDQFDAVVVLDVLEHISPHLIFKALNEIKRVLKKNGILVVSVPLNEGLEELISEGKNPNAHVRVYIPDLICAELTLAGFSVLTKQFLFAFGKYYAFKTFLCNYMLHSFRKPNLIIIKANLS